MMGKKTRPFLTLAFFVLWGATRVSAATITVAADATHILTAAENAATNDFDLAAGATLRLPEGDVTLLAPVKLSGSATIATGDATSLVLAGGLWAPDAATVLTLDGLAAFAVGKPIDTPDDPWYETRLDYARFDIRHVTFTSGAATKKITLRDNVAFVNRPPESECTVEIAAQARILALNDGQDALNAFGFWDAETKTLRVSGWMLVHSRSSAIAYDTIVSVATDGAYYLMPRVLNNAEPWRIDEFKASTSSFREQIVLEGTGAVAGIRVCTKLVSSFAPKVTGTGEFRVVRDAYAYATSTRSALTFYQDGVSYRASFDITGLLTVSGAIDPCFHDAETVSARSLQTEDGAIIHGGTFSVGTLAAGTLALADVRELTVSESGKGATVSVESGVPVLDFSALEQDDLPDVAVTDGIKPDIRAKGGVSVSVAPCWKCSADWEDKVSLWFDANADETVIRYDGGVTYTNGFPLVSGWVDRKGLQINGYYHAFRSLRGLNADGTPKATDEHRETCPYLVTNALNGMNYLSYGAGYAHVITEDYGKAGGDPTTKNRNEARRTELYRDASDAVHAAVSTSVRPAYAILVFGSQQGGGYALLGVNSYGAQQNPTLARGGNTLADPLVKDSFDGLEVRVNGVAVDPTQGHLLNGGWQVISLKLDKKVPVSELGWATAYTNAGGQNYAEVVFFLEAPTDEQRDKCEYDLARKWGLLEDFAHPCLPTLASDGNAALTLADDATLSGGYHGTVTVPAGRILKIADYRPVPGEAEAVVQTDLTAWFDPSCAGSIVQTVCDGSFADTEIGHLRERTLTGVRDDADSYAFAGYDDGGTDRNPLKDATTRGYGTARPWMKFADGVTAKGGNGGNALRTRKMASSAIAKANTSIDMLPASREAYLVLDTSRGGGNVLGANVTSIGWKGNEPKERSQNGTNFATIVWRDASGYLEGATARLDDTVFAATNRGYNGRAEVFSFTTAETKTFQPSVLGLYSAFGGTPGADQAEIIGEVLFYKTPLSDAARTKLTAYLAYKWFGKVFAGYSDVSRARVLGSGRLLLADGGTPDLSQFAGTVATTCATQTFACTSAGVSGALAAAGTIDFGATAAITVTTADAAFTPGTYTLASAAALDLPDTVTLAADASKIPENCRVRFRKTATTLVLTVEERKGLRVILK